MTLKKGIKVEGTNEEEINKERGRRGEKNKISNVLFSLFRLLKNGLKCFAVFSCGPTPAPQEEKEVNLNSFCSPPPFSFFSLPSQFIDAFYTDIGTLCQRVYYGSPTYFYGRVQVLFSPPPPPSSFSSNSPSLSLPFTS